VGGFPFSYLLIRQVPPAQAQPARPGYVAGATGSQNSCLKVVPYLPLSWGCRCSRHLLRCIMDLSLSRTRGLLVEEDALWWCCWCRKEERKYDIPVSMCLKDQQSSKHENIKWKQFIRIWEILSVQVSGRLNQNVSISNGRSLDSSGWAHWDLWPWNINQIDLNKKQIILQ
jgi:hypothetical protein